jgi:hypothetical protein
MGDVYIDESLRIMSCRPQGGVKREVGDDIWRYSVPVLGLVTCYASGVRRKYKLRTRVPGYARR